MRRPEQTQARPWTRLQHKAKMLTIQQQIKVQTWHKTQLTSLTQPNKQRQISGKALLLYLQHSSISIHWVARHPDVHTIGNTWVQQQVKPECIAM